MSNGTLNPPRLSLYRLGLLSDSHAPLSGTPLDTLCAHLEKTLQYKDGERDAVFLRETFTIEWPNKTKVLTFTGEHFLYLFYPLPQAVLVCVCISSSVYFVLLPVYMDMLYVHVLSHDRSVATLIWCSMEYLTATRQWRSVWAYLPLSQPASSWTVSLGSKQDLITIAPLIESVLYLLDCEPVLGF